MTAILGSNVQDFFSENQDRNELSGLVIYAGINECPAKESL